MFRLARPRVAESLDGLKADMASDQTGSVDYERLMRLLDMNGISPLAHKNGGRMPGAPEAFRRKLEHRYLSTLRANMLQQRETFNIIGALKSAGVDAIPLKGSVASEVLFDDLGAYPNADIDILVRPDEMERTATILERSGYMKGDALVDGLMDAADYHTAFSNGTYVVEVHWNLVKRYYCISPDFWWENAGSIEVQGTAVTALSAERYLLYTIFRLFSHAFRPLRFFVLVAAIVDKYHDEIDWSLLLGLADRLRMRRLVVFCLKLLHDEFGMEAVPAPIRSERLWGYAFLKEKVRSGVVQESVRIHIRMLLYLLLLDGPQDAMRAVAGRIFPHTSEIRLRYGLPAKSKLVYIYYLLNPIFLVTRKREKTVNSE